MSADVHYIRAAPTSTGGHVIFDENNYIAHHSVPCNAYGKTVKLVCPNVVIENLIQTPRPMGTHTGIGTAFQSLRSPTRNW